MAQVKKSSFTISKWILFTTIGWVTGFILAMVIAEPLDTIKLEFFGLGLGMATGIGLLQWVALRKQKYINSKWIWFTIAGLGSSYFLFDILMVILNSSKFPFTTEIVSFGIILTLATTFGAYIIGYLQYKFMLKKYFNISKSWIHYNMLGWLICSLIISGYFTLFGGLHLERTTMGTLLNIFVVLIGGPIIGFTTGKSIVSIVENRKNTEAT
jgi:hypothetical protein